MVYKINMRREFLKNERCIRIVCGKCGSGKSGVITKILRTERLSATWLNISQIKSRTGVKRDLVLTGIQSPAQLQKTLLSLLNLPLRTLICEVTITSPVLLAPLQDFLASHDISVIYTLSPSEVSLKLPSYFIATSVDFSLSKDWQVAANAIRAYQSSPETFRDLSEFSTDTLQILSCKELLVTLAGWVPGVSTRTMWYVVKMLRFVVEGTIKRIRDIRQDFGEMLDVYTKNVGLMIANEMEQVQRIFCGDFDLSQMFVVFPESAPQWQMLECNRTASPISPCQGHVKRLLTSNGNYYKHMDVNVQIAKGDQASVTDALVKVLGTQTKNDRSSFASSIVISPKFFVLIVQMIRRIKLGIPVILSGECGSGKSTLVKYVQYLYEACDENCVVISHNPLLQTDSELQASLKSATTNVTIVLVHVTLQNEVERVMEMVHSRTIHGSRCPDNVKFIVELSCGVGTHSGIDNCCILTVSFDQSAVNDMLAMLSIPNHDKLQPLSKERFVSYRSVYLFIKVFSWVNQVFYVRHHKKLLSSSDASNDFRSACVLFFSLELVFGSLSEAIIDNIVDVLNCSPHKDEVKCFSLVSAAKVVFNAACYRTLVCIEVLPLLMTSLETATPLVLKRSSVTLATLQELLGGVEFCCRSKALDCSATPSEVVESYRDCLNEQILSSKKGKIFKRGVLICDRYENMAPHSREVLTTLIKCSPPNNTTCDISVIIMLEQDDVPCGLWGCLLEPGLIRKREQAITPIKNSNIIQECDEALVISTNVTIDHCEVSGFIGNSNKSRNFVILRWIAERIGGNLQDLENGVLITKLLIGKEEKNLETLSEKYGELLPYVSKVSASLVKRARSQRQASLEDVLDTLIEGRLERIVSKEMCWSNASAFTEELRILCSYTSSSEYSRKLQIFLLWFSELSALFCGIKDADLRQFLKVCHIITSRQDCDAVLFSSWVDAGKDPRVLAYLLVLLLTWRQERTTSHNAHLNPLLHKVYPDITETVFELTKGVVPLVSSVDVLVLLFGTIYRRCGVDALEHVYRDVDSTNTNFLSALILVCKDQLETKENILKDYPADFTVNIMSAALVRRLVEMSTRHIADFCRSAMESKVAIAKYFEDQGEKHTFCKFEKIISDPSNVNVRIFVLKRLVHTVGTECCRDLLELWPELGHNSMKCSSVDVFAVIPGYSELKNSVYPVCCYCEDVSFGTNTNSSLSPLVYYELTQRKISMYCDCLKRANPEHLLPVLDMIQSSRHRLGTHARSVLYLSSQLSAHGNAFMRYFHDILLLEDLDSIYWMGMPHDDAFDIINTVRPSEKFAGVDKEYDYYECPNGHIYSINNCGDPLQISKCPECKAAIGGKDHIAVDKNSKYNRKRKQMIETGYTLAGENYKPGKISIRSMSRLSTSVLWYFTHLLYTARSHNNSDQHTDIVLERVESDFKSISDLLKLSSDDTTAFLLNLVNEVSSHTSPSISYATEFVRDSLQPLDVLIMNRNESLKSQRKQWEAEFDRIVVEIQSSATGITFETNVITSSIEIFATEVGMSDVSCINHPCYWIEHRKPCKLPKTGNALTRKFVEAQDQLHLLPHLPYLLELLHILNEKYNYTLDTGSLSERPSSLGLDVTRWYEIWVELHPLWNRADLIYPAGDIMPLESVVLSDVIPSTSGTGSTTLNMIWYLSKLHNSTLPDATPYTSLLPHKSRVIQPLDRITSCLCGDSKHVDNSVYRLIISPLRRLHTERDAYLKEMRLRNVYTAQDEKCFKKFYSSLTQHLQLEAAELQVLERASDVRKLHKVVTALIVSLGDVTRVGSHLLTSLDPSLTSLLQQNDKLFEIYRHVNLALHRSHFDGAPQNTYLQAFFECYDIPCDISCCTDIDNLALLLAEYASVSAVFAYPTEKLLGWNLKEALEFYLEGFSGRDSSILNSIDETTKVDNIGFLFSRLSNCS